VAVAVAVVAAPPSSATVRGGSADVAVGRARRGCPCTADRRWRDVVAVNWNELRSGAVVGRTRPPFLALVECQRWPQASTPGWLRGAAGRTSWPGEGGCGCYHCWWYARPRVRVGARCGVGMPHESEPSGQTRPCKRAETNKLVLTRRKSQHVMRWAGGSETRGQLNTVIIQLYPSRLYPQWI